MSVFSDRLRVCRKAKGYTQEKMCELLGISRDTLSKWENGSRCPDLNELCRICDILECDVDYLIGRIEQKTNKLQITHEVTGLSIESIELIQKLNMNRFQPAYFDHCTNKYRSDIDYLDTLLKEYPELLCYIDKCLLYRDYSPYRNHQDRPYQNSFNRDVRYGKTLCMEVALRLWNYITAGEKSLIGTEARVSKFASDFIYERLSFLESVIYHNETEK